MEQYTTIGYLQSKMIRTPLKLNVSWNENINSLSSKQEIIDYVSVKGSVDEYQRLLYAIEIIEEVNN
jgi:uncharacterized membrane protein